MDFEDRSHFVTRVCGLPDLLPTLALFEHAEGHREGAAEGIDQWGKNSGISGHT